ncbi:hypothetical protein [Priestia megaterium]|uniref:hypothetical protein n=1 Tax=Priestia megaterium TaxID=1404 RepID=UPI00112C0606|nr:hypothetical protein [Priestia megaterium]
MPDFWGKYTNRIPKQLKNLIYQQYFNQERVSAYCDVSLDEVNDRMSMSCVYVVDGSLSVKSQQIHLPERLKGNNVVGEMKAVIYSLENFRDYLPKNCNRITVYSDVHIVWECLTLQVEFEDNDAFKIQKELAFKYRKLIEDNDDVIIKIRFLKMKQHNPFHKAAHNAARKLLNKKVTKGSQM